MTGTSYTPHHLLLRDEIRTNAFRMAISATVREGDVVIDLGAGTGVLSIFAAKSGASKVYAIERDEQLCAIIKELATANEVGDVLEVICGDADFVVLPELADVLICDAMGFFGISEEMEAFFHARERLLKQDGRLVPASVEMWVAPMRADDVYNYLDIGRRNNYGVELGPLGQISLNSIHSIIADDSNLIGNPCQVRVFDMSVSSSVRVAFEAAWEITRDGPVHGLLGWYRAKLTDGISLSSGPWQPRPMGRARFLPFYEPLTMRKGEKLSAGIDISPTLAFWWANKGEGSRSKRVEYTTLGSHPNWLSLNPSQQLTRVFFDECHSLLDKYRREGIDASAIRARTGVEQIILSLHRDLASGAFTGIEKL